MWFPPFHCSSDVCVTHEWSLLCSVIEFFRRWCDGVYITSKCCKFIDYRILTITCKVRWGILQCAVEFAYRYFFWYLLCTEPFVCMLITSKNACSYHAVYASVVSFILYIEPIWITTSSFHGYLNSTTSKLVTPVEFSKAPYSSTLISLHGCCSLFNFVNMKWMMWTGYRLDT